jgi:nucleoside-diphosphate-sugar epimerase
MADYDKLPELVGIGDVDFFFHLAWNGDRENAEVQKKNVLGALKAMDAASRINPGIRFIATGSQAEYGEVPYDTVIKEDRESSPITVYGKAKVKAYQLLKKRASELGISFIWTRLFSLIGEYEPAGRMFPTLVHGLIEGRHIELSSCTQYWDYLDAKDAARALIAVAERGRNGEIYNIASLSPKPLRDYVEEIASIIDSRTGAAKSSELISYGKMPVPFITLRPSVDKLTADTGWKSTITLTQTINQYYVI